MCSSNWLYMSMRDHCNNIPTASTPRPLGSTSSHPLTPDPSGLVGTKRKFFLKGGPFRSLSLIHPILGWRLKLGFFFPKTSGGRGSHVLNSVFVTSSPVARLPHGAPLSTNEHAGMVRAGSNFDFRLAPEKKTKAVLVHISVRTCVLSPAARFGPLLQSTY